MSTSDVRAEGSEETGTWQPSGDRDHHRRPGELTPRELVRWAWRQLTSMRTALILLLLLALGAIPGSVIPQRGVDALKTQNWQAAHPHLTPIYDRLGLFAVYDSAWFAAIYLLLDGLARRLHRPAPVRLLARLPRRPAGGSAQPDPPARPRRRTPPRRSRTSSSRAARLLSRRHRVSTGSTSEKGGSTSERAARPASRGPGSLPSVVTCARPATCSSTCRCSSCWSASRIGTLFGYKGGVILVVGNGFSNIVTQYDDFEPGGLFRASQMEPFCFTVNDFDVQWLDSGPRQGMARGFEAPLTYRESCQGDPSSGRRRRATTSGSTTRCTIDGTEIFLIGHGYAPVITVRDADGNGAYSGPTVFLPESSNFESFGVVKVAGAHAGHADRARGAVLPDVRPASTATPSRAAATTATRRSRCWSTPATSASTAAPRSRSTRWTRPA